MTRVEDNPTHALARTRKATPSKSAGGETSVRNDETDKNLAAHAAPSKTAAAKTAATKSASTKSAIKKSAPTRGFASMDREKQRAIASKGGQSVPDEKRSFSRNRQLAAEAGRKGGRSVPDEKRSFSRDPALAAEAGRKGGQSPGSDHQ